MIAASVLSGCSSSFFLWGDYTLLGGSFFFFQDEGSRFILFYFVLLFCCLIFGISPTRRIAGVISPSSCMLLGLYLFFFFVYPILAPGYKHFGALYALGLCTRFSFFLSFFRLFVGLIFVRLVYLWFYLLFVWLHVSGAWCYCLFHPSS